MARQEERAESDIDLLIVGKVTPEDVIARLADVESSLGRAVNLTVYSVAEFKTKLGSGNHSLNSVVRGKKVFLLRKSILSPVESINLGIDFQAHTTTPKGWPLLMGDEDELGKVGGIQLAQSRTNQS